MEGLRSECVGVCVGVCFRVRVRGRGGRIDHGRHTSLTDLGVDDDKVIEK